MTVRSRKPVEYSRARRLRAEGMSYKRIATALKVSPSSAFAWTSDIRLTEGAKRRNGVEFVNSDPRMTRLFRYFLVASLGIDPGHIRVTLNVYTTNGLSIAEIEEHWLTLLDLPPSSLRKHTLNQLPASSSGRARTKLPYGVCRLSVASTQAVQHIYGAIQEYAGFDEPAWLD